jgi:hypothetical protein
LRSKECAMSLIFEGYGVREGYEGARPPCTNESAEWERVLGTLVIECGGGGKSVLIWPREGCKGTREVVV